MKKFTGVFSKIVFSVAKPRSVLILGDDRVLAAEAVFLALSKSRKTKKAAAKDQPFFSLKETAIIYGDISHGQDLKKLMFFAGNAGGLSVVLTGFLKMSRQPDVSQMPGEWLKNLKIFLDILPNTTQIIYNADEEKEANLYSGFSNKTSYGYFEGAEFRVSDVHENKALNFKVSVKGSTIPVWLERLPGVEQVYPALAAMAVGRAFGLNLVQTAESLKNGYKRGSG